MAVGKNLKILETKSKPMFANDKSKCTGIVDNDYTQNIERRPKPIIDNPGA